MHILLTANSPREVAGWLAPTVRALSGHQLTVLIPPCPFAAGTEEAVVQQLPQVSRVLGPGAVKRLFALGWPGKDRPQVLVFLGGDRQMMALLARRLGVPALAYTEGKATGAYRYFCFPDEQSLKRALLSGLDPRRSLVVGNLMADALAGKERERENLLLFFAGSRPFQVKLSLGYWLAVAQKIAETAPEYEMALPLSPFVEREVLLEALANPRLPGAKAGFLKQEGEKIFIEAGQTRLLLLDSEQQAGDLPLRYEYMLRAKLAFTLPGTNTMELAAAGTPQLVVAPTFDLKELPLEGILGLLGRLPLAGRYFSKKAIAKLREDFIALPNRHAEEMVVPELAGEILPEEVAHRGLALLDDEGALAEMEEKLRAIAGPPGAGARLAQLILKVGKER